MVKYRETNFGGISLKRVFRFFLSVGLLFVSVGVYFSNRIMFMKKKDDQLIFEREKNAGRLDPIELENLPKREVFIRSSFGYPLKAIIVEPHATNKYMIFCHGITENKTNSIKYMNLFLKRGFNAVIYDQRRHGESGGKTTSYGHFEKFDLQSIVQWLREDRGPSLEFGIHGESMGAVTMLLYAGMIEDEAKFYIADCPFSDFKEQLAYHVKTEMQLPAKLLLPVADLFIKLRQRYSLRDVSPIAFIKNIRNPILFIHSEKDDYILPSMTEALFTQKKGAKKLFLAPNGVHAQSFNENKADYEKMIDEFLEDYVYNQPL